MCRRNYSYKFPNKNITKGIIQLEDCVQLYSTLLENIINFVPSFYPVVSSTRSCETLSELSNKQKHITFLVSFRHIRTHTYFRQLGRLF
jgi:hypothetical protein